MHQVKVKQHDTCDPLVHCCIGVHVQVVAHAPNEFGVHLDRELWDTNEPELDGMKGSKEAIGLKLGLRIVSFSVIEGDGSKTCWYVLGLLIELLENEAACNVGRVDGQDDVALGLVVE